MGLWSTLKNTVMAVAAVLNIHSENLCFKNEGIGCFSNDPPFTNAAGKLPKSPAEVGVSFLLHTRQNRDKYQLLTKDVVDIRRSNFNGTKGTKFIIHGYRDDGRETWVVNMKNALLEKEDVNVISVDWEKGADTKDYNQAAANTRVVGALIAQLITSLLMSAGAQFSDMHLIGHSLGAHIAGYAGKRVKGIGRITGLDPAGLAFGGKSPEVRLDPTDAKFVDVIHTDGHPIRTLGLGSSTPMGHADFYPNGGKNQPGCKAPGKHLFKLITGKFKTFRKGIGCDHARARDYFIESINSTCRFKAFPCGSTEDFEMGRCPCNGKCARMGYASSEGKPRGSYYLTTKDVSPFCKE
ncbi:inactive pancreatic lipase-related protein 1-like [Mercenaria mercenaria]|uniref:inactive pancreatic lipase-related protein 1-like n=1 Tax=Mercenaria mercenaria TaxID=6596 RepID=UPI001E1DB0BF|nr:inactive pancreatic lipase-related protein 1-like [Mercenaria mercenaria]XP_045158433.1 inactive pancreatic lipase-related protein 1-like [Mercenaria mercenaria]XP_045158434.1 inactive pancreatic lipase-related protein 1-like [Mercenaria mercenaria]XP_045158435.1 inactive pancreatic lipase-related protein 1-like [Mercenaria mercenaria]XP_045158436.1 inactive pancreatic lipase-related protein 1-like [Mercenaria mercenaria]